jgi:hypothetical protein
MEEGVIPILEKRHVPVFTDYWDAYLLAFLGDGRVKIEAYPWDLVRTYGLITRKELMDGSLWLVKSGFGQLTRDQLNADLSFPADHIFASEDLPAGMFQRPCELWTLPKPEDAIRLMKKYQWRYFITQYPPGGMVGK